METTMNRTKPNRNPRGSWNYVIIFNIILVSRCLRVDCWSRPGWHAGENFQFLNSFKIFNSYQPGSEFNFCLIARLHIMLIYNSMVCPFLYFTHAVENNSEYEEDSHFGTNFSLPLFSFRNWLAKNCMVRICDSF